MAKREALLIGNSNFSDELLSRLSAPSNDVISLKNVIESPEVGSFSTRLLLDAGLDEVREAIVAFFSGRLADDLLLFYYTGHGLRDEYGDLYLALSQTKPDAPQAASLDADFLRKRMDQCHSRRQVMILDCCHSGAIMASGRKSGEKSANLSANDFSPRGYGRFVLAASSADESAFEVSGKSVFTKYLVEGLTMGAAAPEKPEITIQDLHDYTCLKVAEESAPMRPRLWVDEQTSPLVIARNPNPRLSLPEELVHLLWDEDPYRAHSAATRMVEISYGEDSNLASEARKQLEDRLVQDSDLPYLVAKTILMGVQKNAVENQVPDIEKLDAELHDARQNALGIDKRLQEERRDWNAHREALEDKIVDLEQQVRSKQEIYAFHSESTKAPDVRSTDPVTAKQAARKGYSNIKTPFGTLGLAWLKHPMTTGIGIGAVAIFTICLFLLQFVRFSDQTERALSQLHSRVLVASLTPMEGSGIPASVIAILNSAQEIPEKFDESGAPLLIRPFISSLDADFLDSAEDSYRYALELLFRPRLLKEMETALQEATHSEDSLRTYQTLKAYLTLAGEAPQPNDEAIKTWFEDVWLNEFSASSELNQREQLEHHLDALLRLQDDREITVSIDHTAVSAARSMIVQLSLADHAWALIMARAKTSNLSELNLVDQIAPDPGLVFQTVSGEFLSTVGVPGLYTYEGYWGFFFDQVLDVGTALESDSWVLGEQADSINFEGQLSELERALHDLYFREFNKAWEAMLASIELTDMSADKPHYDSLAVASASFSSPIKRLVELVDSETKLSREIERVAEALNEAQVTDIGFAGELNEFFASDAQRRYSGTIRFLLDAAIDKKEQNRVNGQAEGSIQLIARFEERFADWYALLDGAEGQQPIDLVLSDLGAIRDNLRLGATNPAQSAVLMPQLLSNLTRNNNRLPPLIRDFVNDAESDFRSEASDATLAEMNRALTNDITFTCRDVIAQSFPFMNNTRNLQLTEFSRFFGPGGSMDQYFHTYLAPHVIRTDDSLSFDPESPMADRLSPATLRQFERAEKIRRAFFSTGGSFPEVQISVRHIDSSSGVTNAELFVSGNRILTFPGGPTADLVWTGSGLKSQLTLIDSGTAVGSIEDQSGPWSIVAMFRLASVRSLENSEQLTFVVAGRTVTYEVSFSTGINPFTMPELSNFNCPDSIN